jgi:hypothetical protein
MSNEFSISHRERLPANPSLIDCQFLYRRMLCTMEQDANITYMNSAIIVRMWHQAGECNPSLVPLRNRVIDDIGEKLYLKLVDHPLTCDTITCPDEQYLVKCAINSVKILDSNILYHNLTLQSRIEHWFFLKRIGL